MTPPDWLSDNAVDVFLVIKGLVAFTALILAIIHMNQKLHYIQSKGQILRYWVLVSYTAVSCFSTAEQIRTHVFGYWIILSILVNLAMCYAMIVSIREHRAHQDSKEY